MLPRGKPNPLPDSLHKTYKYEGLIISEWTSGRPEESAVAMLNEGSDMLIVRPVDALRMETLVTAIRDGKLQGLDKKLRKILLAKSFAGLNKPPAANADSAAYYCIYWKSKLLYRRIIESSIVLLSNKKELLPLKSPEKEKIALLQIGNPTNNGFMDAAVDYADIPRFTMAPDASDAAIAAIQNKLKAFSLLLINVCQHPAYLKPGCPDKINKLIHALSTKQPSVVSVFGDEAFLAMFDRAPCMLWSGSDISTAQQTVAQIIFGGQKVAGDLPFSVSAEFCFNDGLSIGNAIRFKYTSAEDAGVDGSRLYKIDSIVASAIELGAFPGCQVFVARCGKVFLNKSYGSHTYGNKEEKVKNTDLYDIASVTKVAATTLALMSLYDKGKIRLDTTLNYYFDDIDKNASGKKVRISKLNYITLRDLLTHRSGLPEGLPIGLFISPKHALAMLKKRLESQSEEAAANDTLSGDKEQGFYADIDTSLIHADRDSLLKYIYSGTKKPDYGIQIANNLYLRNSIVDSLWQLAKQTSMRKSKNYLYSDMNLYLVMKVVEKVAKATLDEYLDETFYKPLGLKRTGFNPLDHFKKEDIAPTEDEKFFRRQLLCGYVHDPMAALLGGIGGNAGLFSSAHDLGVIMQLLLNRGTYAGTRYLSEKTVGLFTTAQAGTWRGLGFDRKAGSISKMIARRASLKTFGHTGFTGTCVWADPEYQLVFVFLSNRVNPKSTNQKINIYHVRQNIQQAVYEALVEGF